MSNGNDQVVKQVERMLAVGTPLIAVDSHDHPHIQSRLLSVLTERPVVGYNLADGFIGLNDLGSDVLAKVTKAKLDAANKGGPHVALHTAVALVDPPRNMKPEFPEQTVFVFDNLHWSWSKEAVMQTLLNCREPFKASHRAVIALTLGAKLPADLAQNVSYIEDPLPNEDTLADKVRGVYRTVKGGDDMADEDAKAIARELRGTCPFRAEQLTFQSVTRQGIDRNRLRDNARKQINDTPGLSVEDTSLTFSDIGGLQAIREYLRRYFSGPRRPSVVVRIEEIEKALAGVGTETSGTSGDALGVLLTAMEDFRWTGILAYGVSGCGKSLVAKAAANEFGAKAIRFDINACKGSLVGESEKKIRAAMDVLHAIGGERVFLIASMNQIASLPPELRRRFAAGTWYFDVPDAASRKSIWQISAKQFGVEWDGYDEADLTGADIRDIVQRSFELGCTTTEAATYHVPLCKSAPNAIGQSRQDATNRYLDANLGGPYGVSRAARTASGFERAVTL